jgi:hypothetical protein
MVSFQPMLQASEFRTLYEAFDAPIAAFDCGKKCAPYNGGVPYCCDTDHAVPTAYQPEWDYLKASTDLWHLWETDEPGESERLQQEAGSELKLIECQGHTRCQRGFRSIVCRAFPFFPYIDSQGCFLGLAYYWEYDMRCWVISNLQVVTPKFRQEFIATYERLFELKPDERETFRVFSAECRTVYATAQRELPLLHRSGVDYLIEPVSEALEHLVLTDLPKFGPYEIADDLLFDDEMDN